MTERFEIMEKTLAKMLEEKKYTSLRDILGSMYPADLAAVFAGLQQAKIPVMFRLLPKELAAQTFAEMEAEEQELLIRGFSDNELKEVLDELYVDDAAALVEEMPAMLCGGFCVRQTRKCASPSTRYCNTRKIPPVR